MRPLRTLATALLLLAASRLPAQAAPRLTTADSLLVERLKVQYAAAFAAKDYGEALRLGVRVGTVTRNGELLHRFGHMFEQGSPELPKDEAEAVRVFTLSSDFGHREAQHHVGIRLLDGRGIARDRSRGIRLLEQSAEQHYMPADSVLRTLAAASSAAKKCAEERLKGLGWFQLRNMSGIFSGEEQYLRIRDKAPSLAELRGDVVTLRGVSRYQEHRDFEMRDLRGFVGITEKPLTGTTFVDQSLNAYGGVSAESAREVETVRAACVGN